MNEDYSKYRHITRGYWSRKVNSRCEDCLRFTWCPKIEKLHEVENLYINLYTKLRNKSVYTLEKYIGISSFKEPKQKELEPVIKDGIEIEDEIQKCLNSRTYLAVKKDYRCFSNQDSWGISDCNTCMSYVTTLNVCYFLETEVRDRRGWCPYYEHGEPLDYEEESIPCEEEITT